MIIYIVDGMIRFHKDQPVELPRSAQKKNTPWIMAISSYDIIYVGDFRELPSQATTAIEQLKAITAAGYRTGLLQLSGIGVNRPARLHRDIRRMTDSGRLAHLDPSRSHSTDLLVAINPSSFTQPFRRGLQIDARFRMVLVQSAFQLIDRHDIFDWATINRNAEDFLGGEITWAPTNSIVRAQLNSLERWPRLSDVDWHECIDPAEWQMPRNGLHSSKPIVGRSAPPVDEAWPISVAEILSLYPDDTQCFVHILDGGPVLKALIGRYPENWNVFTSSEMTEKEFLSSIDFFVHSHHPAHANTVDPSLLRAMASGAVAILPPSYKAVFGESVAYAETSDVANEVRNLFVNRTRYLAMSEAGTHMVHDQFSPESLIDRIGKLVGPPERASTDIMVPGLELRPEDTLDRRRVMFITINGVGMGHLTRMLAIAKRCKKPIEPVFVTMSQALKVLRQQGYLAEYIPSRQYLDCDLNRWNESLRDEINEMISFYDPAVVIFDGNVPYQGLIEAIKANPAPRFIWSRRGMWRSDNTDIVGREKHFDIVLEPGDLAALDDHGITTRYRDRTFQVGPIRLLGPSEMLSREEARKELGLDVERPAVLIQLGAGNNYDYRSIHNLALAHTMDRYDAQIAVGEWLISDRSIDLPEGVTRMPGYPFAKYFKAFDMAISAVGYNSFHELLFAGVPTIFVPNEAMEQDNQLARALYADRQGLAVCVRTKEIYRLTAAIDRFFQPEERERIKSRLMALDPTNGAAEAASLIHELAYSRHVDRP